MGYHLNICWLFTVQNKGIIITKLQVKDWNIQYADKKDLTYVDLD